MKKIVKASLLLTAVASLGMMSASAKTMTASEIEELSKIEFGGETSYENIYIYGKNVHVNLITMSDIILSGHDMEGVKDKSLYYKNGDNVWTKNDGIKEEKVTNKNSLPTFEMTKLIGTLNGGHVSEEDGLYNGDYVKTEDYTNGRKAEIFIDETAPLSIVDIRPVQKAADLSSVIGTDTNKYNSSAVSIKFEDNAVTITENSPLLPFHYNNSSASEKWVALLVKTNKPVTKDAIKNKDVVITLGGNEINESRIDNAANHGGASNEFVIWAKASDFTTSNKEITFKEKVDKKYTEPQKITVTYTSKAELFIDTFNVTDNDSNDVEILTEGVEVSKAIINGQHKNIFYTSKSNVTRVDFLVNGDKKYAASTDNWTVKHLLQVRNTNVAQAVESSSASGNVWNQNSVSVKLTEHKSTSTEQYDYIVEISHNKQLKDYKTGKSVGLIIDFSVDNLTVVDNTNASIDSSNRAKAGITNSYEHLVWVNGETIVTFKNNDPTDNTITIKFVLVDETPELNVDIKKGTATDIFPDTKVPTEASANTAYKNNIEATSELELTYDESAKQYLAVIRELKANTLNTFDLTGKGSSSNNKKSIGVIVDLGVDPTKVTADNVAIKKDDIEKAKNHGASSDTAFIWWINEDTTTTTFKYLETEETVKVKFEIRTLKADLVKDSDQNVTKVVVADEYKNDVTYNESEKGFVITDNTTKFVATTTVKSGDETTTYEYTYNVSGTTATKIRNLKLNNAYKIEYNASGLSSNTDIQNNINAVSDVNVSGNTINVTFNKHISKTHSSYCILLDLGVDVSNTNYIYTMNNKNYSTSHLNAGKGNLNNDTTQVPAKVQNNLVVLCVNHSDTSIDEENETYTIKLVNSNASSSATDANTTIPYEIVIKSHVEAEPYLDMENATAKDVVLDVNNGLNKDEIESFLNMDGLTTSIEDDKVYIHYTKDMVAYESEKDTDDSYEQKSYFAILFDLGIDPSKLTTQRTEGYRGYGIAADDINEESVKKFGGSGTQFILWLDKESFVLDNATGLYTYKITFAPGDTADDKYSDPIVVTFILVDDVDRLSIKSENLSERAKDEEPVKFKYDIAQYNINQDRLDYEFVSKENVNSIVVSRVKDADAPVSYDLYNSNYNGQWYAIEMNLDRNIKVSSQDTSHKNIAIDEIDYSKGKFIIWVNVSGDLESNNKVTITDVDSKTSDTLTISVSE